jgi:hypothetical protein
MNSQLQAAGLQAGPGLDTVDIGAFEGRESFATDAHRKRIILRKGLARDRFKDSSSPNPGCRVVTHFGSSATAVIRPGEYAR